MLLSGYGGKHPTHFLINKQKKGRKNMSWQTIGKINSDFLGEPLNFNNYINDISMFGNDSYVLNPNNAYIWNDLALNSTQLYGHSAIHEYVYDRLTNENIDALFTKSPKLGKQLNNFYNTTVFPLGNAIETLKTFTVSSYNTLEGKFKQGYQRFCETYLGKSSGVGEWIKSIYGLELSSFNTISEIISDSNAWDILLTSEAIMVAVCSSSTAMNAILTSSLATTKIAQAIEYVGQNEYAVNLVASFPEALNLIVNDATSMNYIASSEGATINILTNETFATAVFSSDTAMEAYAANQDGLDIMCDALNNYQVSQDALNSITSSMNNINSKLNNIIIIGEVTDVMENCKQVLSNTVNIVSGVGANARTVDSLVAKIKDGAATAALGNKNFFMSLKNNLSDFSQITASTGFYVPSTLRLSEVYKAGDTITLHHSTYGNIVFDVCAVNYLVNGTITLVSQKCITNAQWHSSDVNNYSSSAIRTWLNGTFLNGFSEKLRNSIKAANWACHDYTTAKTLTDKVVLPSMTEMGISYSYSQAEGTAFAYKNIAGKFNGTVDGKSAASYCWTRTPGSNSASRACYFYSSGGGNGNYCSISCGVPVCFII